MITLQFTLGQPNPTLIGPRFMRVPSEKMVHGGFQLPDGGVGSFFYFEDIDLGLVGVSGGSLDCTTRYGAVQGENGLPIAGILLLMKHIVSVSLGSSKRDKRSGELPCGASRS